MFEENSKVYDKKFFNASNFYLFEDPHFKLFPPQFKGQVDSESLINALLLPVVNHKYPLIIPNYQNDTDGVQIGKEILKVITRTEFDATSILKFAREHIILTTHGYFVSPSYFSLNLPLFRCIKYSLNFDGEVEPSSGRSDTFFKNLHVI